LLQKVRAGRSTHIRDQLNEMSQMTTL